MIESSWEWKEWSERCCRYYSAVVVVTGDSPGDWPWSSGENGAKGFSFFYFLSCVCLFSVLTSYERRQTERGRKSGSAGSNLRPVPIVDRGSRPQYRVFTELRRKHKTEAISGLVPQSKLPSSLVTPLISFLSFIGSRRINRYIGVCLIHARSDSNIDNFSRGQI